MADNRETMSFLPPEPEEKLSPKTWGIASLAVVSLLIVAAIATLHRGSKKDEGKIQAADSYAGNLPITNLALSEATNGAGGKSTYVDGTIGNTGSRTLTGAAVQVTFATEDGSEPHRETLPVALIRTRVPYVDLQPVSAEPIPPGDHREFRLIFESLPANWDVKPPAIQIVHADLK